MIYSSLALNLDVPLLQAALPLLEAEKVEAIEWSFDTLFKVRDIPPWFVELLREFGQAGRLVGHGVFFSLFSGRWVPEQDHWLKRLREMSAEFQFNHVTEHFGYMTGVNFHQGAPMSVPLTPEIMALGQDRLQRIADAAQCPVGLENLAFANSLDEVRQQGEFLSRLLEPVNGFIILDLHNLWCQLHNFELDFADLIRLYPLDRVREIHISGGSWEDSGARPGKKIRRDTHDHAVPEEVFALLENTLPLVPNLKFVVLEQMGHSLADAAQQEIFRSDFLRMESLVQSSGQKEKAEIPGLFQPPRVSFPEIPLQNENLFLQQRELAHILETSTNLDQALAQLQASALAHSKWKIETWAPEMLETALHIAQKWKDGW
ncbi:MAG: DUF692 family protein [Bacteroidia bacterium]|nr:DUF692 family protein [Bacteroidia bacterium]